MTSFPASPLPVNFFIAPGANPADVTTANFIDITSDVRYAAGIQIKAGRQDETSKVNATSHQVTLDDTAGNYSSRNPLGAYFGQLRKGTPVQTRINLIDDTFARTVATGLGTEPNSGQAWSTTSAYSVNGSNGLCTITTPNTAYGSILNTVQSFDVNILKCSSVSAVATGAAWVDATLIRYQDGNNFFRIHTEFATGGIVSVKITRIDAGTTVDLLPTATTSVTYTANQKIWTRVQAIGSIIRIKVWQDGTSEPTTWNGSATTSFTTNRGTAVGMYEWLVAGNTNTGGLVASFYEWRCDTVRATTPVPEWSPRWSQTESNRTTPIVGGGVLRRLSSGAAALRSPMYRQITGYTTLVGYWPVEDGSSATSVANAVSGGRLGIAQNMSFGGTGPSGSAGAATFSNADASSRIAGNFIGASSTAGWQISWACKLASLPSALNQMFSWVTTNGYRWAVNVNTGVYNLHVIDGDGNVLLDSNISNSGSGDPNQWIAFRLEASVSGGTVTAQFAWYAQGAATVWGTTSTFSGSVGALSSWSANGNTAMQNGLICQVYGVTTNNDNLQSFASQRAFDGYAGEQAADRLTRLAAEEGVPMIIMGNSALCVAMGVQGPSTLIDLFHECEDAEQGLLIESGVGLGFLTYGYRTNVPVAMALDFNAGHIAAPPEPTDDDQNLVNLVKLSRKNGSEVTVQDTASIALSGTYSSEPTVNLGYDADLANRANWLLHMGTINEMRWPKIELKLHAQPSLIPAWCSIQIGSRITIANPPVPMAGSPIDLIVEGYTETITTTSWDVELNCSPAKPWDVAIYNTSRYDSKTSVLSAGVNTTATTLSTQAATFDDCWDPNTPYDIYVAPSGASDGEHMTVTSAPTPTLVGAVYTQSLTVTRSVNGIVVAHAAGESLHIATPGRPSV